MKTYSAKPTDVTRQWYIVDASEAPLGRVATKVATLLTGKGKPQFTKHIDTGDFVIIINAAQTVTTGDKVNKKMYYRQSYSCYPQKAMYFDTLTATAKVIMNSKTCRQMKNAPGFLLLNSGLVI